MTDTVTDTEPVVAKPRLVRRAPARAKPAPRVKAATPPADPVLARLDQILGQQSDLAARLEIVERGSTNTFIEGEAPRKPTMREANPEAVSSFTRKLLERTHDMPANGIVKRDPDYNIPLRWFLRRDGDYVQLQGDAQNRALYQDLGFYLLTDAEAEDFLEHQRPGIVLEQQTRAALINGLRDLVQEEATLSGYRTNKRWEARVADMSIRRLEDEHRRLCRQTPTPVRDLPTVDPSEFEERDTSPLAGIPVHKMTENIASTLVEITAETADRYAHSA